MEEWKDSKGLYCCPYCEKSFTKWGIATHIFRIHIESEQSKQIRRKKIFDKKSIKWNADREELQKVVHICERCGKQFQGNASKYSCNRFCSRSCANKREHSLEVRSKIRSSLINSEKISFCKEKRERITKELGEKRLTEYNKKPKCCKICGKTLNYKDRNRSTCSQECANISRAKYSSTQKNNKNGIGGWYKGIWCDSTYELAFIIYCLDHNIKVERNKEGFEYEWEGRKHLYFPDFIIDGKLIEIKGFNSERVQKKIESVNKPIIILYEKDLQYCFDYIKEKYGKEKHKNIHDLYK